MTETTDFWKKHNYEWVLTEDQSPTLRWLGSETQETMHHRGGAYSETQMIYGNPLRCVLAQGGRSALSVGLGLGYNEILVAVEALKSRIPAKNFRLRSYEADPFLVEHFLNWLKGSSQRSIYDDIFVFFQFERKDEVQSWLLEGHQLGTWQLEGALTPDFRSRERFECIFYDAFSSKTSPYLWQEEFLGKMLRDLASPCCQFSTYACTGALKRALRANGFQVQIRDGFQSKRSSTLGLRLVDVGELFDVLDDRTL